MRYALLYKPPCGVWYAHSHKLYLSVSAAEDAVVKFLPAGTEYSIVAVNLLTVQAVAKRVPHDEIHEL